MKGVRWMDVGICLEEKGKGGGWREEERDGKRGKRERKYKIYPLAD